MMTELVTISNGADSAARSRALALHEVHSLPVLVIFPHNQCNCRCVMCDIWRIREGKQITPEDLEEHLSSIKKLGVRWVVFSGGEPQLNQKWSWLAQMLRGAGCRVTLLTAGLLLEPQAQVVVESIDDVIVSVDGPAALHNSIRRVRGAFQQMAAGVAALRRLRPAMEIRGRCTVQKANHQALRSVVLAAKEIGLTSISFLAGDLTSSAFNRTEPWPSDRVARVALAAGEVDALEAEVEALMRDCRADMQSGFVVEPAEKLRRIVRHFQAQLGQEQPVAPRCNAPWVSAVVEASGDVRPCFFHPVMGNIHERPLAQIINSEDALRFRAGLDVAGNSTCRRCVCSLYIPDQTPPVDLQGSRDLLLEGEG
ncbi:MAG TPA: radical SAM protein [Candidatus Sulfotelmatobacter sp.]|nr:radical SAM protein [Candidatus Sulfotelmatobacter sp.]